MHHTIVFSHANSFPAGTYRLLFDAWRQAGWRVVALPRIGHDPAHPVTNNWPHLRDELLAYISAQAPGEKVHLVGHSLGGFLSMLVASKQPALARSVVLLDAPVVAGWRSHVWGFLKLTGTASRRGPGRVALTRRHQWLHADAAYEHFAAKPAFARWDARVLRDYIACGTEPDPCASSPGGVRLAFDRKTEAQIYDTVPHHLGRLLRRHPLRCPVAFIGGQRSVELRQAGMAATRSLVGSHMDWVDGSHLFPMEKPLETAAAVLRALGSHRSV
jgi:pimeloyl-ACP methyl ester carboxylesterase